MPPPVTAAARFDISYREETEADRAFTAGLYMASRAEEVAQSGWPAELQHGFLVQQEEAQRNHYRLHYTRAEWLVVEQKGAPIGRLYLEEWTPEIRVIDIAIAAPSRGAGIGRSIIEDVIADAATRGKKVSIHVEKNNPARFLYARLGFTIAEDKGVYDLMETPAPA